MKKSLIIIIISAALGLALAGIFIFVICSRMQRAENSGQEIIEQDEKEKMDEAARLKFKEILGIDVPDGISVNQYYFSQNTGYAAIDMVFEEDSYDNVFRALEEGPVRRNPLIFQKENIYGEDNPIVFNYDDNDALKQFPVNLGWYRDGDSRLDFIVGYMLYATGQNGYTTKYICWILVRDTAVGNYHIMIES